MLTLFLQDGIDAVEVVCRPHLLHGFLDLVLLSDGLVCRGDALNRKKKRSTEDVQTSFSYSAYEMSWPGRLDENSAARHHLPIESHPEEGES